MRKINLLILLLALVGLAGFALLEGFIKPEMRAKEEEYILEQREPLTHDFASLLVFKSRFMGDASNLANLNAALPLGDIPKTFQLDPGELAAEVFFQAAAGDLEEGRWQRALVYNSSANFVLIDNLEVLTINFSDFSFVFRRDPVEQWYGTGLDTLQDPEIWQARVQKKLADRAYVHRFLAETAE